MIEKTQHGFFPAEASETAVGHGVKDIKEFFQYYPKYRTLDTLQQVTEAYFALAQSLAHTLLDWIGARTRQRISASALRNLSLHHAHRQ